MLHNGVELKVRVKGRHEASEYRSPIDQQTYIEGRDGSDFSLEIRNTNPHRILVIPSVDGLSVLDGKPASDKSSGYIIEANSHLSIPGWKVDGDTAAKFFFAGEKGGSYSEQAGHGPVNKGVIGLMVFKELVTHSYDTYTTNTFLMGSSGRLTNRLSRGMSPTFGARTMNAVSSSWSANAATPQGATLLSKTTNFTDENPAVEQTLGTGFGEATEFATKKADFKRGDLLAVIQLYYDDKRGLKKRGIELDRVGKQQTRPNAFPAMTEGCAPPVGWKR